MIQRTFDETSDIDSSVAIQFALHDFGDRGASSTETASLGGMAHLVNFWGSDTIEGIIAALVHYNANITDASAPVVARTIPASEHSTITSWGKKNEVKAFENMIDQFGGEGKIFACVSDSYDIFAACKDLWGNQLKDKVINNGGTLVVRPDSGDPTIVPIQVLDILMDQFGYTTNSKGYKVLPSFIKVIQGDGITEETLDQILQNLKTAKISVENIVFGMGGGLLQNMNRDTLKYAMKASAIIVGDEEWKGFSKSPVTDKGKESKEGVLKLVCEDGIYKTVSNSSPGKNLLKTRYLNGNIMNTITFEEVRANAKL